MREHVRGVVIAIVLIVYGIAASPLPKSVKRSQFEQEIAVEELGHWVAILARLGIEATPDQLAGGAITLGQSASELRTTLLGPFRGWFRVSGTGQGWGLFTYPDSYPHRLTVEVRGDGSVWRPIYVALDAEHNWKHDALAYRRVRGVYDGNTRKPGASYDNFVSWVGRMALADYPDTAQVRVGFVRYHTTRPGHPADTERLDRYMKVVTRGAL